MRVGVVVDHALYEDMTMTLGTPTANFEGYLQTIKEQSGEKSTCMCLHTKKQ